jgi:nitrite reductase (NADH) large subunit
VIPVPGHDLPGVVSFRDMHDVETMIEASRSYRRAVVIGGGLLGLEAANGLLQQGMEVTVVHLMDTLMERQLDAPAAAAAPVAGGARPASSGCRRTRPRRSRRERVTGVRFKDGSEMPADLVVMAVGIRPNIELAQGQRHRTASAAWS